jgi:hypothetical protein
MIGLPRFVYLAAPLFALLAWSAPAPACPFCQDQGVTLVGDVAQADLVIYVTIREAKQDFTGRETDGTTEVAIDAIIKDHPIRGDKKVIEVARYIPDEMKGKYKFLLYCSVFKGKLEPFKGIAVKSNCDLAKYLKGTLELKDAPIEKRLKFAFDYLDNDEFEISNDAYKEFANADYKDYAPMAKNLPADKIAGWLDDPKTSPLRYGLYGSMLGHCGTKKHAALLRKLVENEEKRAVSGVDGILAGYMMLDPKEGWEYVRGVLTNRHDDFMYRYAALRCVRFIYDYRQDLVNRDEMVGGVANMITHSEIGDLAIEDLRKWRRWELTDRVLALENRGVFGVYPQPAYNVGVVNRAVLRFALADKDSKQAVDFVERQRKKNPERVKQAEELLRLEQLPNK